MFDFCEHLDPDFDLGEYLCELSTYSQEGEEGYLQTSCLDTHQSEPLRLNNTPEKSYSLDNETDVYQSSPCSETLQNLMEGGGEDSSIVYAAGSRSYAKTLAVPAEVRESQAADQDYGPRWPESLARYNPHTYSWKTRQCSLLGGLIEYSETLPRWGMMRDGEFMELTTLEAPIIEKEYGYLPTPTASDYKGGIHLSEKRKKFADSQLKDWLHVRHGGDWASSRPHPSFTEGLMMWPAEWTDLKPLVMGKFQQWQRMHRQD